MLYTIERDLSGYSDEQVVAAGFRAQLCISFFPGTRWLRSYYDRVSQQARCFYESPSAANLRHHSNSMAIPIGDVRPVVELRPKADRGFEYGEPNDGSLSRDETGVEKLWVARLELQETDMDSIGRRFLVDGRPPVKWVRAFVDATLNEVFAIYRAEEPGPVHSAVEKVGLFVRSLVESEESLPSDVSELPEFSGK